MELVTSDVLRDGVFAHGGQVWLGFSQCYMNLIVIEPDKLLNCVVGVFGELGGSTVSKLLLIVFYLLCVLVRAVYCLNLDSWGYYLSLKNVSLVIG